ncbi:MAG: succinylglutamate desuccinylase/aspartoacylase family protein [Bacteroidia bacterium]|nr:succinylglutamate desuccinylase/aspartoacylase family protein [Bacteroidia bacterium]
MPEVIKIHNHEIHLGENKAIDLVIAKLPTHTKIDIPVYIYRAKEDGPVLLLTAGIHGDEINGIETVRQIIADKEIKLKRGTVICIPCVNIFGFLNKSRDLPDGRDLNRCFPGSKNGSLASRLAYAITEHILPVIDYGIDLHTAAIHRTNYPHIRCNFESEKDLAFAKAFGADFILNSDFREKSLRKVAYELGKPVIVLEAGEALRLRKYAVREGKKGIIRAMQYLDMIPQTEPMKESKILKDSSWVRAKNAGLFRTFVQPGAYVKKDDLLASLSDPFGQVETEVRAPQNGYVIGLTLLPVINAGDALIHLAE